MIRNVLAGIVLLAASSAFAQPTLSPQVQADLLLEKITTSMEAGRAQEALDGLVEYRKLGVKMPPAVLFLEARLAAIAKDYPRSKKALTEYLADPNARADKNYGAGLSLLADIESVFSDIKKADAATAKAKADAAVRVVKAQCAQAIAQAAPVVTARQVGSTFRECVFAPEMVIIPGGTYLMGAAANEAQAGFGFVERPQHQVSIAAIAVGKFEVTFDEWDACTAAGGCNSYRPSDSWGRGRQPVINISWDDAQAYVSWLSEVTGQRYRLLSEAEWEYAARAGTSTAYSTGASINTRQANFQRASGTRVVGSYPANKFGLHDMHGNMWEWTQDCWGYSYQGAPTDGAARMSADCSERVIRSGSFFTYATWLRSASRHRANADSRSFGFRVARELR